MSTGGQAIAPAGWAECAGSGNCRAADSHQHRRAVPGARYWPAPRDVPQGCPGLLVSQRLWESGRLRLAHRRQQLQRAGGVLRIGPADSWTHGRPVGDRPARFSKPAAGRRRPDRAARPGHRLRPMARLLRPAPAGLQRNRTAAVEHHRDLRGHPAQRLRARSFARRPGLTMERRGSRRHRPGGGDRDRGRPSS